MQAKKDLRKLMQKRLNNIDGDERLAAGINISQTLRNFLLKRVPRNSRIALFTSLNDELNTEPLVGQLLYDGFRLSFPVWDGHRHIHFKDTGAGEELHLEINDFSAICVPGLAFDKMGHRLGRGKGCYDSFLSKRKNHEKKPIFIGLGLDCQVIDQVPFERHDQLIDFICTPITGIFPTDLGCGLS